MKQKTTKSAIKRVHKTGQAKLMRRNMSAQHLSAGKSKRVRSAANKSVSIAKADQKKLKKLIPNK